MTLPVWVFRRGSPDLSRPHSRRLPADTVRAADSSAWLHLRRFARYLTQESSDSLRLLSDPNVLLRYKESLLSQKRLQKTAGTRYNFARQVIRWLAENEKDGPWKSAILFR